ncbi:DUF692 family protein [Galbibacter sp. BG1]|uniref:DUF692 domain-containing protein n=1 Tax=Galbibacter sp. BG1 TaxID=1170699 RepID=UPI0015B974AE|nr:DUF692 family multinuclear iron-containing protein [Galbibacter sp. BG1]QLE01154.1 DUF692 family protein [Galbibacter sp. BG1]
MISKAENKFQCLPELGVGIIYSQKIKEINFPKGLLDTLEIEPQTLCIRDKNDNLILPKKVFKDLNNLPYNKLVHSIGAPVGGSVKPTEEQLKLIDYCSRLFNSPWITEHLSFNATTSFNTGFFLPPCQTEEGLQVAIENIQILQSKLKKPIAIETGVNYLRCNNKEIEDGNFVAELCKATDCGILLDIHNLFANQLNGRQSIETFIGQIPKDNVVEIHIAGGTELNNLWLDSHSGPIDQRLLDITKEVLPEFKNLKAVTYEVFDSYLPIIGDKVVIKELEKVRNLWESRKVKPISGANTEMPKEVINIQKFNQNYSVKEWENTLANLAIDRSFSGGLKGMAKSNPDRIAMYQSLIKEFRASMIARIYKLTVRYLMLTLGMDAFYVILQDFWSKTPPEQLSYKEAQNFAQYLENKAYKMPWLYRLLRYEVAILNSILRHTTEIVSFDVDPMPMLNALHEGKLPEMIGKSGDYEIEITPDAHDTAQWTAISS